METVICLSTNNINILQGSYKPRSSFSRPRLVVNSYNTIPTPGATVINGKIMEEHDALLDTIRELVKSLHIQQNTTALIDSDYVKSAVALLAPSRKNDMLNMAKSVLLNERDVYGDAYLYDFSTIDSDVTSKSQKIVFCCALLKTFVDEYKTFYDKAKIKLKRMDVTLSGLLKLTSLFKDYHPARSIICMVDDLFINLISLKKDGSLFFHRKRFTSKTQTADYYTEVVQEVIKYIQFKIDMGFTRGGENKDGLYIVDANLGEQELYKRAIDHERLDIFTSFSLIGLNKILIENCVINGKNNKPFIPSDMMDLDAQCYNLGSLI